MGALILVLASSTASARFDASVDATSISEADSVRLTLRTDGVNLTSNPDLEPLTNEFDVLSNQRSTQIQSFNGSVDALTTWTLLLKPKRTGTLQIPAITLGGETTRPIEITVKDLDPQLKRAIAQTVFFETTYTPKSVYVQSQIVVTRRLFYVNGAQLYGDMPNAPEVPGAMVKLLGEAEHTTAVRDGRQYGTIEQRFAVFPERSGDLTIPAATVTGSVRLAESGVGRRIGVDVSSEALRIPVLPIPAEYPHDAPWLPAADVELLEDWPGEPEHGLAAGTPSQRTLIVRAEGNASSAIPPLAVSRPDSLKAYPEPPKLSETQTRGGIVGTRTESTSLVATRPGDITLPEVHVTWWDTARQQVRTAALPARTIKVTGTAATAPPATAATPTQTERESAVPAQPRIDAAATEQAPAPPASMNRWLAAAFAAALLGWAITAWRSRYLRSRGSNGADTRAAEKHAYAAFRRACDVRDARRVRSELDRWLTARYALPLVDAKRCFAEQASARDAIDALNARLYRHDAAATFDPLPLRRCVDMARHAARSPRSDELPSLYPSP
jgi:hypothetical protein